MLFSQMNLDPRIIQALDDNNIASPTEIQENCIPHGISSNKSHIIGQAKTGSGKTLAFAIPIVEQINPKQRNIQAIIVVPTRELCKQNAAVFRSISKYKHINLVEVYGGASIRVQIEKIRKGGQVLIATPGRLIDLIKQREINTKHVKFLALDEADRMLDMGFLPDVEFILLKAMRNVNPRLFLFSATMLEEIKKIIRKFTRNDKVYEINVSKDSLTVDNCVQFAYDIDSNKFWNFIRILNQEQPKFSIIFTKTKRNAEKICKKLVREQSLTFKLKPGFIHGDVTQAKREKTVQQFRNKELNCLVATNVLARGMDFPRVSHVFNYDLPRDPEDYVHRIGRTARTIGIKKQISSGKAISLVTSESRVMMKNIEKLLKKKIERRDIPNSRPIKQFIRSNPNNIHSFSRNSKSNSLNTRSQSPNNTRSHSPNNPSKDRKSKVKPKSQKNSRKYKTPHSYHHRKNNSAKRRSNYTN